MPQTSPSSVGNGLDRSEPLPYIPQQNFIPRPIRDVEDAVPYIYFHDSSQIYFAPFTLPYRTFAAPLSGGQRAGRPTHHISPPQFLINSYLLPPNYFLRPTAILQLCPLSAGGKM